MDIDSLTLEEKVGQLFMVSFNGTKVTGELIQLITYFKVGGLFYSKENVTSLKQLYKLSTNVQFYAKTALPLFIATEQKGGEFNQITDGLTISPSQAKLGLANNRLYTKQMTEIVAKELRAIGINMNFAPALNLANNQGDQTQERYFSEEIDHVAKHGVAAIQGYEKAGVCSVATYFPGIIEFESTRIDYRKSELYPFYRAIKHGISGIFIDDALFSTQSYESTLQLLSETLRGRAQFDGVIVAKVENNDADMKKTVISALQAGVDIIFLPSNYKKQIETMSTILEAVKAGKISEERIDESIKRIVSLKEKQNVGEIQPFNRELFRRKRSMNLVDRLEERASVSH